MQLLLIVFYTSNQIYLLFALKRYKIIQKGLVENYQAFCVVEDILRENFTNLNYSTRIIFLDLVPNLVINW